MCVILVFYDNSLLYFFNLDKYYVYHNLDKKNLFF